MIFDLVKDFADVLDAMPAEHPRRRILKLLDEAIRRDVHFIERRPTTFFQCMWNTCWWYDCPEADKHYKEPQGGWKEKPPWEREGPRLHRLLGYWRSQKKQATPGFPWLRSLRPPAVHLGSAQRAVFRGHEGRVTSVAFSPDGTQLVSGSSDSSVRVWDVHTCQEICRLDGHGKSVFSVAFSPDGREILSGAGDSLARFHAQTGEELRSVECNENKVQSVAFSTDGTRIATCSYNYTSHPSGNYVQIWDADTGVELAFLSGDSNYSCGATFSPDGSRIVGGNGRDVQLWETANAIEHHSSDTRRSLLTSRVLFDFPWRREMTSSREDLKVKSVAYSPDGRKIATGSEDTVVRVFDAEYGAEMLRLEGHEGSVNSVDFSPDGRLIVSCSDDTTLRVWDSASLEPLHWLNGKPCKPLHRFEGHENSVMCVAFSPNGQLIASGSTDKTARLWDLHDWPEQLWLEGHQHAIESVAFCPVGDCVVSSSWDNTLGVWDKHTGRLVRKLKGHLEAVWSVAFSPDGKIVVSGSGDETVRLWDVSTGEEVRQLIGHKGTIWSVAFSPDGSVVASGAEDRTVRIWEVRTGEELRQLEGGNGIVWSVAFSPDGRMLASATDDGTVRLWDLQTGEVLNSLKPQKGYCVTRLRVENMAFSPDGRLIALRTKANAVRLWTRQSSHTLRRFEDHETIAQWSIDDNWMTEKWGLDGHAAVQIWDVETCDLLETISGTGDVTGIASRAAKRSTDITRAIVRNQEMIIEDFGFRVVAWFPAQFRDISTDPSGRRWAGEISNHLYLVQLEGDIEALSDDS